MHTHETSNNSNNNSGDGSNVKRDAWGADDAALRRSFRSSWEQELEALELLTLKAEQELLHGTDSAGCPAAWHQCHSHSLPGASVPIEMAAGSAGNGSHSLPHSATSLDDHAEFPTIAHAEEMLARSLEEKAAATAAAAAAAAATTPDTASGGGSRSRSSSSAEKSKGKARAWSAASYDAYEWNDAHDDEPLDEYDPCQFEFEEDIGCAKHAALETEVSVAGDHYEVPADAAAAEQPGSPSH